MAGLDYFATSRPTQLAAAMTNISTIVAVADGSTYPDPAINGKTYTIILGYGTDREEVCTVTSKTNASTFVVTRGQDNTPATAKNLGDTVVHGVSARDFKRIDAAEVDVDALEAGKLNKAGDTMTGPLVLSANASAALQAVTKQQMDAAALAAVPIGVVTAFGGATAPAGWHLCDGTVHGSTALQAVLGSANTPDLRGLFVVGAAPGYYALGATGGAQSVALTAAQSGLPAHTHTASVSAHTHDVPSQTVDSGGMSANAVHGHTAPGGFSYAFTATASGNTVGTGSTSRPITGSQLTTNNADTSHTHSVTVPAVATGGSNPAQTVTVAASTAAGAASAHENRPPYYALTYIIKKV